MPSLRFRVSATTPDALATKQFNQIPAGGAILNMWAAGVTTTDSYGLSIGNKIIMVNGSLYNVEIAADVVDNDRDQLIFNELVPQGQLVMPVTVTTEGQFLLTWKPLIPQ